MAGHRKGLGKPTREQSRTTRMAQRLAAAQTPEQRAAAAFDGLRMAAAHSPRGREALETATHTLLGLTATLARGGSP